MSDPSASCTPEGEPSACALPSTGEAHGRAESIFLTEAQWKERLTPGQYEIMRNHGTEPPFRNAYWNEKRTGIFLCAASGLPLFSSQDKFDSGTGWPSFTKPIRPADIGEEVDRGYGMVRTEVYCRACGGHLGHVFPDGPRPTRLRYCINSAALVFVPVERTADLPGAIEQYRAKAEAAILAWQNGPSS